MTPPRRRGRKRQCPDEVLLRVLTMRRDVCSLRAICSALNADGVPTPGGGARWWPSHVSRLLATAAAKDMMDTVWPS